MSIGILVQVDYPKSKRSIQGLSKDAGHELDFAKKTGIRELHVADEGEVTTDLAIKPAKKVLEKAPIDPKDLDQLVWIAEGINDYLYMDTSKTIIQKLGGRTDGLIYSYDFHRGSNGTIGVIKIILNQVMSNPNIQTSIINSALIWENHSNNRSLGNTFLGDGSGAILLKKGLGNNKILSISLTSMSGHNMVSGFKYGGTLYEINQEVAQGNQFVLEILNDSHFQGLVDDVVPVSINNAFQALFKANLTLDNIDYLGISGFHQEINNSICTELYQSGITVIDSLETKGYMGSIGVIDILDKFLNDPVIEKGSTMLVIAVGLDINVESMIIRK